ncbi:hypothetical protein LJC19_02085 [Oxalobacter sp. OttesenSCG-928-P03]|nr:hypothetical protein [Oxalobacter sp. OttesenSCG-928-P03]
MIHDTTSVLAPVAVFVYNRLSNTQEVVKALQSNYLAKETDVYFFSDGPKDSRQKKRVDDVRSFLRTVTGFKSVTIIEREKNYYIEQNIIQGVTQLINKFGRLIILEDDGVTAPHFLTFMNQALTFYESKKQVMHIGTFTFINLPENFRETFFWRYCENGGGGWATWKDRWEKFQYFADETTALASLTADQRERIEMGGVFQFLSTLKLQPIPWDICWYMTVARNNGLAVQTPHALTINNGLYNGTHFGPINRLFGKSPFAVQLDTKEEIIFSEVIEENERALELLKQFYDNMARNKRAQVWHAFLRILVFLRITKLLKRLFK